MPTRDKELTKLDWALFTFGPGATISGRSFSEALGVFKSKDRVAICLFHGSGKKMLVRRSQKKTIYSFEQLGKVHTCGWKFAHATERLIFHNVMGRSRWRSLGQLLILLLALLVAIMLLKPDTI